MAPVDSDVHDPFADGVRKPSPAGRDIFDPEAAPGTAVDDPFAPAGGEWMPPDEEPPSTQDARKEAGIWIGYIS